MERLFKLFAFISAFIILASVGTLIGFLILRGFSSLNAALFFGDAPFLDVILRGRPVWEGIWPAFAGTFYLVGVTMAMALVPGVGCGIYLARFAKGRKKEFLTSAIDLLASVPSIVMGLFGFVLILTLRKLFAPDATTCLGLAAFCLALLVLPALVVTTRTSLESLPPSLEQTGRGLGFSEAQILRCLLLPAAGRGILGGIMLSMGRATEDTAVIMLTGVVVNSGLPAGLGAKFEALPFLIYYTAAQYIDEAELLRGFGAALVLLILSAGLMGAAWALQRSMENRWKGVK